MIHVKKMHSIHAITAVVALCVGAEASAAPVVSVVANPTSVASASPTTISWNASNATSCTASGTDPSWTGAKSVEGTYTANPSGSGIEVYNLSCTDGSNTTSAAATVTVTSAPPPATADTVELAGSIDADEDNLVAPLDHDLGTGSQWNIRDARSGRRLLLIAHVAFSRQFGGRVAGEYKIG
jgi:hypothetical protein